MSTATLMTASQLFAANLPHCELIEGEVVAMSPAGFNHGRFASRIVASLENFVSPRRLGVIATAEAGFQIATDPDTVRSPDVAFVRAERIPAEGVQGFFQGAPDLAVEVISPFDRASEIAAKVRDWLRAGSSTVWVVDPETRTVTVHTQHGETIALSINDAIMGADALADFSMSVSDIFSSP